ncbi:tRNA 2-thiocytidine(32) synthetase TtcA [Bartonella taylorii]|uniref:tRNA-cytidine(32) 2-sulfurtransferase n=1 Tax=Bartonella taylorii TaxID=33046 RepID=A0A9Q9DME7_BARTA|nr:tRNA 2-thiocytidine(32) synthetase TtcA [Bartonella taylorii]OPB35500.1 tRNA 2-thiocytidine biosynthesis protein TtcA [Bartonella taylorii]USP03129.1 tRNA 2-thiocytidine(32) synthetase TtcA [Bartonella taylorii]
MQSYGIVGNISVEYQVMKENVEKTASLLSEVDDCHPIFRIAPSTVEFNKLRKRLLRHVRQALDDFSMLSSGDKWLIALSGGKDSYGLLALLLDLKWRGLLPVEFLACNLDQGQPGFPKHILPDFLNSYQIPYRIEHQDTYSIVTDKLTHTQTYCSLCSRLRRGNLYRIAREEGCSALVLGHHRDDVLETFFMNLFHGGRLAAMPGKLINDEGDLFVLRPLVYAAEEDMEKFSQAMQFPIIPCNLCGSQDGLQRNAMKEMLRDIERRMPGRKDTIIRALTNVRPSHLLDKNFFDFTTLL